MEILGIPGKNYNLVISSANHIPGLDQNMDINLFTVNGFSKQETNYSNVVIK